MRPGGEGLRLRLGLVAARQEGREGVLQRAAAAPRLGPGGRREVARAVLGGKVATLRGGAAAPECPPQLEVLVREPRDVLPHVLQHHLLLFLNRSDPLPQLRHVAARRRRGGRRGDRARSLGAPRVGQLLPEGVGLQLQPAALHDLVVQTALRLLHLREEGLLQLRALRLRLPDLLLRLHQALVHACWGGPLVLCQLQPASQRLEVRPQGVALRAQRVDLCEFALQ
mmetsp:Transcript_46033/g.124130  ORF Transcript_46033/g.124130 Transcript_46033/m.124130 type:complete len:226 (+) Transcript_46033:233-910(+)